ncbi:MAG: SDR family NAD(P)-dependent oxidoreductase [Halobacteriales archaeon]|nr:SDR family NAD(P)-dependent oxidoreductase [Halobacteriales archaeon]
MSDGGELEGRTAMVTGSAKGVGRAILLALAEAGASVAVHYHSSEGPARETATAALERGAPTTTLTQGDVTDPEAVDGLFDSVEETLGPVDVLVNNVGDFAPVRWDELDYATWNRVLETNLNGTYLCSKRALGPMREAGWGRIVNIGYAGADRGLVSPKNFPYFVAKAGVLMFTRMLAADTQADGVTVNAVSPYVVENSDRFPEELPRGRPAEFADLAGAVGYFASDAAGYVSGANLEVAGGWLPEDV